jgi:hypothetical protein
MRSNYFAVVPVKDKENKFVIWDHSDPNSGSINGAHQTHELTEEETRSNIRARRLSAGREYSEDEIDAILAKSRADGPLAGSAA